MVVVPGPETSVNARRRDNPNLSNPRVKQKNYETGTIQFLKSNNKFDKKLNQADK
jgi:hypothetical protein